MKYYKFNCAICGVEFSATKNTRKHCSFKCRDISKLQRSSRPEVIRNRLDKKICITPGCWYWTGAKDNHGYGVFRINGIAEKAHRSAYRMYVGEIPKGMTIMHRCDNPVCVNPHHLVPGSQTENMRDMVRKGRQQRKNGEDSSMAKLTEKQVMQIYADTRCAVDIAGDYGVSAQHVRNIKNGKTWCHLKPGEI